MADLTTLIRRTAAPGVEMVIFNRPQAANALSTAMGRELLAAWTELSADPTVRVVILAAEGRIFCAGADLKERNGMTDEAWADQHKLFEDMIRAQLACPVPLIAAVAGAAVGGGCEMALACDFTFAADTARFGLPEVGLGIIPGLGGTQLITRAVGPRRAAEMMMSGKPIGAAEALAIGLVNRICPAETLLDEAVERALQIAANAPLSVRALKRLVREGPELPLDQAMALELSEYDRLFRSADRHEGVSAFNQKRPAKFSGR